MMAYGRWKMHDSDGWQRAEIRVNSRQFADPKTRLSACHPAFWRFLCILAANQYKCLCMNTLQTRSSFANQVQSSLIKLFFELERLRGREVEPMKPGKPARPGAGAATGKGLNCHWRFGRGSCKLAWCKMPTAWRAKNRPICCNTGTIRWIGSRGAGRPSRARARRTSRSSSASAIPPAIGAMSWSGNRSRTRRSPPFSTRISSASRWTGRSGRTWTKYT